MNGESSRRKAAVWIGAVFLLGAALGSLLSFACIHHGHGAGRASMSEQARRARRIEQLTREVGLTAEQNQKVSAIITETHAQMKTIHQQSDVQIDEARQKARNQIRAILAPEQLPKFEEFIRKLDEERRRSASQ